MRQVVGKQLRELDAVGFAALRDRHDALILDIGTGDGKHVRTVARAEPATLVVGLDAAPDAMQKASARAAAKPARGGLPNALFVRAAVETLPPELDGVTEVHVLMPWGSLLRALVAPDAGVLRSIAAACRPEATFLITLNLHAWRPPVPEVGDTSEPAPESIGPLVEAYADAGWTIESADYLDGDQIGALGTSWTKRLGATRDELAVLALRGRISAGTAGSTRRAP